MQEKIRLDKFISAAAGISRKASQTVIRQGRITQADTTLLHPDSKIDSSAQIFLDGEPLEYSKFVYILMNKPPGILSASRDSSRETVVDLLPPILRKREIFPAGRLDLDTTGLLILTDDGDFAHRLLSPKSGIPKKYIAKLDKPASQNTVELFRNGIILTDGTKCLPAELEILTPDGLNVAVTLREGKFHQVKRMLGVDDLGVMELHRIQIGSLILDSNLKSGEFRPMTQAETAAVLSIK